ncbi:hypothetical protein [Curtobacterium sp. MCBD17_040]|uniref:hypothetical protein n=1 Tax=Curtobacterium sp. MCBD17_040 TaxID=2175674 RepID=UPI0011B4DA79|nr:hypothetical protein [Curtobacterium sp. MCBD17_040]WIB65508.1 hypothetical protein DEI94_19230 [Curtobacterium sp. MCBD17_040]
MLRAADIVVAALQLTGTRSLDELVDELRNPESDATVKLKSIQFDTAQLDLIDRYHGHLQLLRNKPSVAIAECPTCETVWVVGTKPSKCTITRDCPGIPEKSSKAKRTPLQ